MKTPVTLQNGIPTLWENRSPDGMSSCGVRKEQGTALNASGTGAANRDKVAAAFDAWMSGTGYIAGLLADNVRWTIVGHSAASRTYESKQQFIEEVLDPFSRRFATPFRPVAIHGLYADGDTVIILWDGAGTARDGQPYENTYAWFLTFGDGLVVEATAFFDSIAFNDLWSRVAPVAS